MKRAKLPAQTLGDKASGPRQEALRHLPVTQSGRDAHGNEGGGRPGALALDAPFAEPGYRHPGSPVGLASEESGHGGGHFHPHRAAPRPNRRTDRAEVTLLRPGHPRDHRVKGVLERRKLDVLGQPGGFGRVQKKGPRGVPFQRRARLQIRRRGDLRP